MCYLVDDVNLVSIWVKNNKSLSFYLFVLFNLNPSINISFNNNNIVIDL